MKKNTSARQGQRGFTLIEMLLVMVIMGIMLAVIVPRAWRANVDSKYTLCRQNCTELAKYTQEWCESMLQAQPENATSTLVDYYNVLRRNTADGQATYVATNQNTYWSTNGANTRNVHGRLGQDPETTVSAIAPQDKKMRNPFNGADVFALANYPYNTHGPVTGAIAFAGHADTGNYTYFALLFQGTDNTAYGRNNDNSFHAGMGVSDIGHVRNGIFVARIR